MDSMSYRELRQLKDYRIFRRTQRIRAFGGFICVVIFWLAMYFANNPEFKDSYRIAVYLILGLITLASLYSVYIAFIKIPVQIVVGTIQDKRWRMVRQDDDMDSSYIMEYGIMNNGKMIYGINVGSYTGKNYRELNINDEVICFSFGGGAQDTFLIKK